LRNRWVPQDYQEAVKWFTQAAEQGNAGAQFALAVMYRLGEGITQDYEEAAKWLAKAAEQGIALAQFLLGGSYKNGQGVPQDYEEAAKWYTRAAEQGNANAQLLLGGSYEKGQGVPQDYKEAVKWYTEAAEQGNASAQYALGLMYWTGKGVLEDYAEAYKWFILAGTNGVDTRLAGRHGVDSQSLRSQLRKEMTPGQIEEAQRRARVFLDRREQPSTASAERQARVTPTASAFLITADGYLLTACHAVKKTGRVEVFHQQRTYPAKVVVHDEATDVALLKIDGSGLACLPLVSSATAKAGDVVFTMGFPQVALLGAEPKFTEGSISALSGLAGSPRFFQISVPVQPGNSGGPLVNQKGEVVGVIVSRLDDIAAPLTTGSVPQTVNYAVKSSFVLPLLESVPGLSERLAKSSPAHDRPTAIENARKAVVLIVSHDAALGSGGSLSP